MTILEKQIFYEKKYLNKRVTPTLYGRLCFPILKDEEYIVTAIIIDAPTRNKPVLAVMAKDYTIENAKWYSIWMNDIEDFEELGIQFVILEDGQ